MNVLGRASGVWCVVLALAGAGAPSAWGAIRQPLRIRHHVTHDESAADTPFNARMWLEKRAALGDEALRLRRAYSNCVAAVKAPARNVTVPVENYADGSVKAHVTAEKAQFFMSEGLIWGEGVIVSQFTPKGEVAARVCAENCLVDRATKSGWAEGRAKIFYGGTSVEGEGVYFSLDEEYVAITAGTRIVSTDLKLGGLKL